MSPDFSPLSKEMQKKLYNLAESIHNLPDVIRNESYDDDRAQADISNAWSIIEALWTQRRQPDVGPQKSGWLVQKLGLK